MNTAFRLTRLSALLLVLLLATTAAAQDALDPRLDATFGSIELQSGFLPDPYIRTVTSGGAIDAGRLSIGDECRGFVTSQPDFRFFWTGASMNLRIFFVGQSDATLIVRDPVGDFICNDDYRDGNPLVDIAQPLEGEYNVWVGSYANDEFIPGYVMLTEKESEPGYLLSDLLLGAVSSEEAGMPEPGVDAGAEATFGSVSLEPGFQPDPFAADILSGGDIDIAAQGLGRDCVGYVAELPDFTVNLTGDLPQLRMFFVSNRDTTLVVRAPDGSFFCNDESFNTSNPTVDLLNAPAGQYDIWVGSFNADEMAGGTLYVTELDRYNPTNAGG